jgi:hypothetical protein
MQSDWIAIARSVSAARLAIGTARLMWLNAVL